MKAYVDTTRAHGNLDLCYSNNHLLGTFSNEFECSNVIDSSTTHYLIADVDVSVNDRVQQILNYKDQGIKIILMVFDPAAFPRVQRFVDAKMLDKVILFDEQFRNRFSVPTYITDYFFNEKLFPIKKTQGDKGICIFGHLQHGRPNIYDLPKIDDDEKIKSYFDLYSKIQGFNGVAVYDTGLSEDRSSIVVYNKAKPVESLMCGVDAYCRDGIKTKRYQRFLKKFSEIPDYSKKTEFSQEEIFKINRLTIDELVYEMLYS